MDSSRNVFWEELLIHWHMIAKHIFQLLPLSLPLSLSLSLSLSLYTHKGFLRSLSPPSIWRSVTPPPAADGPAVGSLLVLLSVRTAHTPSQPASVSLTHSCTILTICLRLDILQAAHLCGAFELFEHLIQEKKDQSALRYEVWLNKPTRRVFFLLTLKTTEVLDVHHES